MKPTGNKKVQVYKILKSRIISGELEPGLPINEAAFAEDLGVSKTPIREALRNLERDGLVDNIPGRGSTISHISSQEVRDVFQIREIIESGVAKRVAQLKGNPLLVKEYERTLEVLESKKGAEEFVHEHGEWEDVHLLIIKALDNQTLLNMYSGVLDRITRIRNHFSRNFSQRRFNDIVTEHAEILDAIINGDAGKAEEKMLQHLRNAGSFILGMN